MSLVPQSIDIGLTSPSLRCAVRDPAPPAQQVLYNFADTADLARWRVFSDQELGGKSEAHLDQWPEHPVRRMFTQLRSDGVISTPRDKLTFWQCPVRECVTQHEGLPIVGLDRTAFYSASSTNVDVRRRQGLCRELAARPGFIIGISYGFWIKRSVGGVQGAAQFHGRFSTEIADDESRMQRSGFCGIHTLVHIDPAVLVPQAPLHSEYSIGRPCKIATPCTCCINQQGHARPR